MRLGAAKVLHSDGDMTPGSPMRLGDRLAGADDDLWPEGIAHAPRGQTLPEQRKRRSSRPKKFK